MANPRKLQPGNVLGRYVVRERLGRGATATVYLAVDRTSGAHVALKALHSDLEGRSGSHAVERLKREIVLAQRISHPGVCRVYDIDRVEGVIFLAMQYLQGPSLEAALEDEQRFAVPRAARIGRAICRALDAAHQLDILHRDLKPSNIMLGPLEQPSILDFGFAIGPDVGRLTGTGVWVGTLHFAAPELLKGQPASKASDLFGVGCVLYRALTGRLPFDGDNAGQVADALLFRDPTPLEAYVPEVPAAVSQLVLACLRREPRERPASVMAVEEALAPFDTEPAPVVAAALGPPPESAEHARRERTVTTIVPAVLPVRRRATVLHAELVTGAAIEPVAHALLAEVDKWDGTAHKASGSALVATFDYADDAVRTAIGALRELCRGDHAGAAPLRIGIATSMIRRDKSALSGDAVGLAAAVAGAAGGDDILLADSARLALKNPKLPLSDRVIARLGDGEPPLTLHRVDWSPSARTAVIFNPLAAEQLLSDSATPTITTPGQQPAAGARPAATTARAQAVRGPPSAPEPAPPATTPPPEAVALREEHARLLAELARARQERGVLPGDSLTVDGLERTATVELSRGKRSEAVDCVRLAIAAIAGLAIDRGFIVAKTQRVSAAQRRRARAGNPADVRQHLAAAMRAMQAGDFVAANQALNRALVALD